MRFGIQRFLINIRLRVFAWGFCLGISAYFCGFLRIVTGYVYGIPQNTQEPARVESGPRAHQLKTYFG